MSFYFLLMAKEISGRASFSDLGVYCYGKYSIYFINVLIAFAQFGYPIIFFIVFGDVSKSLIDKIMGKESFLSSRWCTHTALAVLMLFLILRKEIQQLKIANFIMFGLVSCFLVIFFIHYMITDPNPENEVDLMHSKVDITFVS